MNYTINPNEYFNMFACPKSVVDEHLKLCNEVQLKVLISLLSGKGIEEIADALSMTLTDIKDALDFWVNRGVVNNCEIKVELNDDPVKTEAQVTKKVAIKQKPNSHSVALRCNEDERLKAMLSETQRMLGRLISPAETSTLIWLHDDQGLEPAVILMAVQYAAAEGIKGFSYIEKMCIGWANDGVCNVKDAEEKLKILFLQKSAWGVVESAFGIPHRKPTKRENEYSDTWINKWNFKKNMIEIAYEKCIDATGKLSFNYINKILQKWKENGIFEPDKIENDKKSEQNRNSKTSYSVEKISGGFNNFD